MKIYCLCIKNINFILLKKLKLIPVGLGGEFFDKRWLNNKNKKNISIKNKYYESVFPWLEDCEKKFGFKNLKGYKTTRIYGYLAERYTSFWFNKYTKSLSWPINFFDTSKIR
jgi:hypothetical protein